MQRTAGLVNYEFTYKKIKHVNLRVKPGGLVLVSAPRHIPLSQVDEFVLGKAAWIARAREQMPPPLPDCPYSDEECLAAFSDILHKFMPLVQSYVPNLPELKVRKMKSRWGVCTPAKRRIVLNKQLLCRAREAQEYVVLHELVHFAYPNHQAGFHREMARLMPDYKQRRALLKRGVYDGHNSNESID